MALSFETLRDLLDHGYDTVIDVRSPAEYAEDHIPGAINLPVLDNEERARVGTIYKQQSPFLARKLGAALVFRNAAAHVEGPLAHHDGAWRPLVYCWRGGQRSGSMTWMLQQIGWRAEVIAGGYRTYRRLVHDILYDTPLPHRLILLDGYTGTAKTEILHHLAGLGTQVLDLEGLAEQRLSEERERLEAAARAEADRLEAEARARVQERIEDGLGVTLQDGQSTEDALRQGVEDAVRNRLNRLLGGSDPAPDAAPDAAPEN